MPGPARTAVAVVFACNGIAFASFVARTPAVRDALSLSPGQLGLLLLCLSGGAVVGLPVSGPVVHRIGPARAVLAGAVTMCAGLAVLAAGVAGGLVVPVAVGLVLAGLGNGVWDVAMNVEGAAVEQAIGTPLMPLLHAAFSVGTVSGAAVGAVTAATGVPLPVQLWVIAALTPLVVVVARRRFLPPAPREEGARSSGALRAWREPRTLAIGATVLSFAFTEGSANDWIALAFVDGHGTSETLGAAAFACFVAAMTIGRLLGGWALPRLGRVVVLRSTAVAALAGLSVVVFAPSAPIAFAGAALWGLGASLGFPVGMSAAADDPARAAARVSVVSSIGYTAFLAGPPLIGLLAEHSGILRALVVVLGALALGALACGATRPRDGRDHERVTEPGKSSTSWAEMPSDGS